MRYFSELNPDPFFSVLWIRIRSDQELFPRSGIICSGSGSIKHERAGYF